MKYFNSIIFFLVCFSGILFLEVATGAMGRGALTTIERQFHVDTKRAASLSVAYQTCNLGFILVFSYLGKKYNRPRLIGFGSIIVAIGFLLAGMPHFLMKDYNYKQVTVEENVTKDDNMLCRITTAGAGEGQTPQCRVEGVANQTGDQPSVTNIFWMVLLSYVLAGLGSSALFPLGYSYIDDHSAKHKSAMYIAVTNTMMLVGNAAGYAVSGGTLKMWVDFERVEADEIEIGPEDPRWIGAWWFGYVTCGSLMLAISLTLFFFPKTMKTPEQATTITPEESSALNAIEKDKEENGLKQNEMSDISIGSKVGGFSGVLTTCKNLFLCPVYVFTMLTSVFAASSQVSIILFSPKYLEVNFGVSASNANYLLGLAVLPCSVIGTLTSGYIMKRWKLERKGALRLVFLGMSSSAMCGLALFCLGCNSIDISGVTIPYSNQTLASDASLPISAPCNDQCGCKAGSFSPVCGADGVTYLSPCHAGCLETTEKVNQTLEEPEGYSHCACVESNGDGKAVSGKCSDTNCPDLLVAVIVFEALGILISAMVPTPTMVVVFRSVPREDKPVGIGVSSFLIRCLGFIPSQIILAAIIDTTCIYWSADQCEDGFCKIYDNSLFRTRMFGLLLVYQVMAVISSILAYTYERRERVNKKIGWC